jgi:hypothetical protein
VNVELFVVKANCQVSPDGMKRDLNQFLIFYNFNRGHGGPRKEIKVRTPYEALEPSDTIFVAKS